MVNPSRCEALATAFVAGMELPGPLKLAAQEPLLGPWWRSLWQTESGVAVNPPLLTMMPPSTLAELLTSTSPTHAQYLVLATWDGGAVLQSVAGHSEHTRPVEQQQRGACTPTVSLLVHEHAEASDVAAGMLHAYLLRAWLLGQKGPAARVVQDGLHLRFGKAVVEAQWAATRVAVVENRLQRFVW